MSYQAIYRIWRPQTFHDLVGQPHVKQTLMNALNRNVVAHAYLFSGPRGTGKTSAAKLLAKAVNCLNPTDGEPCNECEACVAITRGNGIDVEEIDAASNRGVDEIRQLRDKVQYAPTGLKRKVYIIDEVHMLTTEAFNALLKTLEEPPAHTLFVLATTEPHKIPGTIISRCQRFDFRRIAPELMIQRLQEVCATENWTYQDEALWKIAQTADGGLRDALGLLEQTAAFGGGEISAENAAHVLGGVESQLLLRLLLALWHREVADALTLLGKWYESGKDAGRIVHELLQLGRDLVIVKMSRREALPGHLQSADLHEASRELSSSWLMEAVRKLGETYTNLRYLDDPRLALEAALLMLVPEESIEADESVQPAAAHSRVSRQRGVATEPTGSVANADVGGVAPSIGATSRLDEPSGQSGSVLSTVGQTSDQTAGSASQAPGTQRSVATESSAGARKRPPGKSTEARKQEVLRQLLQAADASALNHVQEVWPDVLQRVKERRVQTHAWLMNGEAMLATGNVVVLAFSSRFHRDTVMKPEERSVIEQALAEAIGASQQILALLREDWEKYADPASDSDETEPDLAETAVRVFGKDVVEIIDGE